MNNFIYDVPTKVFFGKDMIQNLPKITEFGKNVLLVYGGGSIKKIGLYQQVLTLLSDCGCNVKELSGVDPNPRIETVYEGVKLCKQHNIEVVLAVGGGSVIDCAKVIAAAAVSEIDAWELVMNGTLIKRALPIVAILTLAAAGSEMDAYAVISNLSIPLKKGTGHSSLKPKMAIMDPTYTYTVSAYHTGAGSADIFSHLIENYFTRQDDAFLQARMCEALLKTVIQCAPIAIKQPDNYMARANLMWASSLAINGLVSLGAEVEWSVHGIEHELSAFYDITHGAGLAIIIPFWMEHILSEASVTKFYEYGVNIWGIDAQLPPQEVAHQAITKTRQFFNSLGMPATLSEVGIDEKYFDTMIEHLRHRFKNSFVPLTPKDLKEIYLKAL